jgi:cell wall-associated NlpC family hydrolase
MRFLTFFVPAVFAVSPIVGCASTSAPADEVSGGSADDTMSLALDAVEGDEGDGTVEEDLPLFAADDDVSIDVPQNLIAGAARVRTTANLNLRKSASTSASVLAVIPKGTIVSVLSSTPSNGFYNVQYNGVRGWSHAKYLTPTDEGSPDEDVDIDGPASPANAIARAKAAVGFSYYWGGAAWLPEGPSASTKGSCSGSCPSCTHSGKYGADCSGLVGKAWQFGVKDLTVNSHPYGTIHFNVDSAGKWKTISRGALKAGDALVYNKNGSGHIVLYEKGDGWGSPTVYECRSCSYGCVYNTRSFGSIYHAIRREGF